MHNSKRRVAGLLLMAAITLTGVTRGGCLVPSTACRFARYLAASQNPEVKASLYEKVVYSFILATHGHGSSGDRT